MLHLPGMAMTLPDVTGEQPFMVGELIPGYCGGTFSLDTADDELRVEAVGFDWIVLRDPQGGVHFYTGSHADLRKNVEYQRYDNETAR